MLIIYWTTCSEIVNHCRCYSQCNWKDLHDHLLTQRLFTLTVHRIYLRALQNYENDWDLLIISDSLWFCILREVGAERKMFSLAVSEPSDPCQCLENCTNQEGNVCKVGDSIAFSRV